MSPTEDQLRAALQDGQGPGVDPDLVISRALAARRERRVQYGSIAAVVAVVAGIGVIGGVALSGGHHHTASSTGLAAKAPVNAPNGVGAPSAPLRYDTSGTQAAVAGSPTGAVTCPGTLPPLRVPTTSTGPLFDAAVSSITICVYPEAGGPALESGGLPINTVLRGTEATQLAASLDGASKIKQAEPCPLYRTSQGKLLVIIGVRADGTRMAPIEAHVLQNPCNLPVTNGTAVRYNWSPPASLSALLTK